MVHVFVTLQENSGILTDIPTENEILGISRGISEDIPRKPKIWFPRNFLGIYQRNSEEISIRRNILMKYRGKMYSSEFSDENSEEYFVGTSEDWTIGKSIEISRRSSPSVYSEELSDELVVLGISSEICFLGIPSENSEGFPRKNEFPKSYFRGLVSSALY
ncbi:hypothetical protein F2Q69_00060110 [Brassica cretica]|uniref:Uncharacterized protein n=1 Tax=Brassica cretica TaxID=69181 RepID=A0A8S9RHH5_BRACR|nr:hypothetical protein F2Q69_00060110 [Brassica cretica]